MIDKYLDDVKPKEFKWGECDCVLFVSEWAKIKSGIDPSHGVKGKYKTEKQAYKLLKDTCGDFSTGLDKFFKRVDPAYRQKGDIALCLVDKKEVLGIAGSGGFIFFKAAPYGVKASKTAEIKSVWRVE